MKRIFTFIMFTAVTLSSGLFCYDDNLLDMVKSDKPAPGLDRENFYFFPNTPSDRFWTSSMSGLYVWGVYYCIAFGQEFNIFDQKDLNDNYYVRCVSTDLPDANPHETLTPVSDSPIFSDNSDGTITDVSTGLLWLKCPLMPDGLPDSDNLCSSEQGTFSRNDAVSACSGINFAGKANWRLPTVPELFTIRNMKRENPSAY